MTKFDPVWRSLERQVADGRMPGLVAGIRHRGEIEYFATGSLAFDTDEPVRPDTRFRIASLSKPVGAAVVLSMVADGVLGLDDPVARWLPEFAEPRVLVSPAAPLDQTVPADRPITVRHLLTMTFGMGASSAEYPVTKALRALGNGMPLGFSGDEFMAQLAAIPLAYQPGTQWMYHMGFDVLSVLIGRVAGTPVHAVLKERITDPLGLRSTSFQADGATLPTAYLPTLEVPEEYDQGFAEPPQFESFSGGLVSTAEDYLTFLGALADDQVIPRELREQMTSDQLTPEQRAGSDLAGPELSWGFGVAVNTAVTHPWTAVGRYGWSGASGTSGCTDPSRDLTGVVFTQRITTGTNEEFAYFWGPLAEVVGND